MKFNFVSGINYMRLALCTSPLKIACDKGCALGRG
jgi:hypothetical protein